MELTPLDLVSAVMGTTGRGLDFSIVLKLRQHDHAVDAWAAAAASSFSAYPLSACRISGRTWSPCEAQDAFGFEETSAPIQDWLQPFQERPMDLRTARPVRQRVVRSPEGTFLVTRFHHAAFDGDSAGRWLACQLAHIQSIPAPTPPTQTSPMLRHHPRPVRKTACAPSGPSAAIGSGKPSPQRRFSTVQIPLAELEGRRTENVTVDDQLGARLLDALERVHDRGPRPLALWVPVNIRQRKDRGFGNGSSRIRIYGVWPATANPTTRVQEYARQRRWALRHGEWHVPPAPWLRWVPMPILRWLLRAYLGRPGVDMATAPFTHLDLRPLASVFEHIVDTVIVIPPLDKRHACGFVAVTTPGRVSLTVAWDPSTYSDTNAQALLQAIDGVPRAGANHPEAQ